MDQSSIAGAQLWAAWLQAGSSIVLLLVTSVYVWLTWRIRNTGERSATAAQASVAEMREQRLLSSQPLVITRLRSQVVRDMVPQVVGVSLLNVGNGPALVAIAALDLAGTRYRPNGAGLSTPITVLTPGEESPSGELSLTLDQVEAFQTRTPSGALLGQFAVNFFDIYGRSLEVHVPVACDRATGQMHATGMPKLCVLDSPTTARTTGLAN